MHSWHLVAVIGDRGNVGAMLRMATSSSSPFRKGGRGIFRSAHTGGRGIEIPRRCAPAPFRKGGLFAAGPAADATDLNEPGRLVYARTTCAALLALVLLAHLCAHAQTITTRWEQLERAAEQRWRTALDDAPAPRSLGAALSAWALYDELRARLDDPADTLDALGRYQPALALDGVPRAVYDRAYALFWRRDYPRAENLFALLLAPENNDGFTIGNAHFWTGFLQRHVHGDTEAARRHYLQVHRYPACLVFTDEAVLELADIYRVRGTPEIALALLSQQIPCVDFWRNEHRKAARGHDIARAMHDVTNTVRHLLRMALTTQSVAVAAADFTERRTWPPAVPAPLFASIAVHLERTEPWPVYQTEITSRALAGPDQGARDPALADCLLHDWPSLDAVAEAHPEILTNRALSNNIFEQVRRTMLNPPQP